MIVLNVTYKCRPGMREAFLEAIRAEGIDEASRAEAGNLKYDYYLPFGGGDELLLVESGRTPTRSRRTEDSRIFCGSAR